MTIVELGSGELWVHSPVNLAGDVQGTVEALGSVKYIVAPNKIHSLGVEPWKERYPSAEVWVSEGCAGPWRFRILGRRWPMNGHAKERHSVPAPSGVCDQIDNHSN